MSRFVVALVVAFLVLGGMSFSTVALAGMVDLDFKSPTSKEPRWGYPIAQADTSEKTEEGVAPPATSENRLLTPEEKAFIAEKQRAILAISAEMKEILSRAPQDPTEWNSDALIEKAQQIKDLLREMEDFIHENNRRVEQKNALADAPKRFDGLVKQLIVELKDSDFLRGMLIVAGEKRAQKDVSRTRTIGAIQDSIQRTREFHSTIGDELAFFKGQLDFWWRSQLSTNQDVRSWRDELINAARALERAASNDVLIMEMASTGRHAWLHIVQFGAVDDIELPRVREITPELPVDLDKTAAKLCIEFTDTLRQLQHKRHVCRERFFAALARDLSIQCIELQDKLAAEENQQPAAQREEETTPASFSPLNGEK